MTVADQMRDLLQGGLLGGTARDDAIKADRFSHCLKERAAVSLDGSSLGLNPADIARELDSDARPVLAHLDFFSGNIMCQGSKVTGVLDFGMANILGDRRMSALLAPAYLHLLISPDATDHDRTTAQDWLSARNLSQHLNAVTRWLAAYWSFENDDDPALGAWFDANHPQDGIAVTNNDDKTDR